MRCFGCQTENNFNLQSTETLQYVERKALELIGMDSVPLLRNVVVLRTQSSHSLRRPQSETNGDKINILIGNFIKIFDMRRYPINLYSQSHFDFAGCCCAIFHNYLEWKVQKKREKSSAHTHFSTRFWCWKFISFFHFFLFSLSCEISKHFSVHPVFPLLFLLARILFLHISPHAMSVVKVSL